jgi:hypothetical protein
MTSSKIILTVTPFEVVLGTNFVILDKHNECSKVYVDEFSLAAFHQFTVRG